MTMSCRAHVMCANSLSDTMQNRNNTHCARGTTRTTAGDHTTVVGAPPLSVPFTSRLSRGPGVAASHRQHRHSSHTHLRIHSLSFLSPHRGLSSLSLVLLRSLLQDEVLWLALERPTVVLPFNNLDLNTPI